MNPRSVSYPELPASEPVSPPPFTAEAEAGYCMFSVLPPGRRPPLWIATVDGERRPVRVWPGGDWQCPFCGAANGPGVPYWATRYHQQRPCANPACIAGGSGSAEAVAEIRAARAARAAREREAGAWAGFQARAAARAEAARTLAVAEARIRQAAEGWCWECWWHSTDGGRSGYREKITRHREPGNCPRRRRYARD